MRNLIIVCSVILLVLSCKKDSAVPSPTALVQSTDNILYHDVQPDTLIHSVLYYANNPDPQGASFTVPASSTASIKIDLDGDAANDFILTASHSQVPAISVHCEGVSYSISIDALNSGDSVRCVYLQGLDVPENFVAGSTIDQSGKWKKSATISMWSQCTYPTAQASFTASYIAIKMNNRFGYIHVASAPLNGIVIEEYGLNLTSSNSIKAGQTH